MFLQQASFHPDVSEEVRTRALRYGTECTLGYLDLLEHVLVVRRGVGRAGAGEELSILSLGKSHLELHAKLHLQGLD